MGATAALARNARREIDLEDTEEDALRDSDIVKA
jgi:hypothetical protein